MTIAGFSENRPGRIDTLSEEQEATLKEMWTDMLKVFVQPGKPWTAAMAEKEANNADDGGKRSKWSFRKADGPVKDLFTGTTKNPQWLSLPLEEALPMIPGQELARTFWAMCAGDNPDAALLRFLRACRWDLQAGLVLLYNCLRWRIVTRVDDITALGEHGIYNELERLKKGMGRAFVDNLHSNKIIMGGPDKNGRPIAYFNVRFHSKDDQDAEVTKILCIFVLEWANVIAHQPVENVTMVFNMEGFSLANMDIDFVKYLFQCFDAFYPNVMGCCIVHKAPWVFSTVWSMISSVVGPMASRIKLTKNLDDLSNFIRPEVLPGFLTGAVTLERNNAMPKLPPPGRLLSHVPKDGKHVENDASMPDAYTNYLASCEQYLYLTFLWTASKFPARHIERKRHAQLLRHAAIRAECILRGRTSFHDAGIAEIVDDRLILSYMGNIESLDITDDV
ncbi:CRAL-TRIO domain-containing protein [Gongronella butleri]|nr:CRAL-TRIO domain-containing protein [Gongronella butleri]